MELRDFWRTLLRRWYLVVLTVVLATAGLLVVVSRVVGPTYTAEGTLLLFPPRTTLQEGDQSITRGNPYLYLDGMEPARDILIRSLGSKSVKESVAQQYSGASFEVVPDIESDAAIILVQVSAPTGDAAVGMLDSVMTEAPRTLADLQSELGVKQPDYITVEKLTEDSKPERVFKTQIRAGIVAGGGIMALGLLLIGLLDALLARRRARADRAPAVEGESSAQAQDRLLRGGDDERESPAEPPVARAPESWEAVRAASRTRR